MITLLTMKLNSILYRRIFVRFSSMNIFDRIAKKEIPCEIVYENQYVLAFKDIHPCAPVHLLIIPKNKNSLTGISKAEDRHVEILGRLLLAGKEIGEKLKLEKGYRLVINEGKHGCQSIGYLHVHFLAGQQFGWPPV